MYGVFVDDDRRFSLVTEYAPRGSLSSALETGNVGGDLDRIRIALGVARGINYLHSRKPKHIVHCDVRLNSVVLAEDGRPMLVDFGLAQTKVTSERNSRETRRYAAALAYVAPEISPDHPCDRETDIFSFGMLLWALFTGESHIPAAVRENKRPEIPSSWPAALAKLVNDCWAEDPSIRPKSLDIVSQLTQLEKFLTLSSSTALPVAKQGNSPQNDLNAQPQ